MSACHSWLQKTLLFTTQLIKYRSFKDTVGSSFMLKYGHHLSREDHPFFLRICQLVGRQGYSSVRYPSVIQGLQSTFHLMCVSGMACGKVKQGISWKATPCPGGDQHAGLLFSPYFVVIWIMLHNFFSPNDWVVKMGRGAPKQNLTLGPKRAKTGRSSECQ